MIYDFADMAPSTATAMRAVSQLHHSLQEVFRAGHDAVEVDWSKTAHIHHSTEAVIIAAAAQIDPEKAALRFPKSETQWVSFVSTMGRMDGTEKAALASIGGIDMDRKPEWRALRPQFLAALLEVIDRHQLRAYFKPFDAPATHQEIRPLDLEEIAKATKKRSPIDRLALVTIIALYNGGAAADAFKRDWNPGTVEALRLLAEADRAQPGTRVGIFRLLAYFPGW
jgi:hypothetical protein